MKRRPGSSLSPGGNGAVGKPAVSSREKGLARMRAYRLRHGEAFRERERERLRQRYAAGWREDPIKKRARNSVAAALRHGVMQRGPCEVCGALDTQAHHSDYTRPRDVNWLCRTHHEELHHPSEERQT